MALLRTIAESLSNFDLEAGVVEEIIDSEALFEKLPFTRTDGKAYVYNREKTLAGGDWLDPNEVISESASEVEEVTTKLRILIGDVDVDKFLMETMSDTNSQFTIQLAMKAKGMGRQYKDALVNGDNSANAKQFDGLNRIVKLEGREVEAATNGAALDLAMLDELLDEVKNGADFLMMRRGTLRAMKQLWRANGGNTGGMMQINNFGLMVPAHDGIPIIINDFIGGDETQGTNAETTSIYAIRANEADGLHGLFGGANAGMRVEDLGTVQNKDAIRTRLKWYTGLALKSTQSVCALRGITNI